jgi:hypothetical protein
MIRDRGAGCVANHPAAIATRIGQWLDELPAGIAPLSAGVLKGLSRTEQFVAYEEFIRSLVN